MTTNKVCGKGKCKFTDEFCASGDCPYDTDNIAKNVAQRNSQTLTEQWKRGKLETGEEYWVILTDESYLLSPGVPVRAFYSYDCEFEGYLDNDIEEILAPVPSYEQWQSLNELLDSMNDTNKALAHRLNICKELLKECKQRFEAYKRVKPCREYMIYDLEYLTTKIDEVLND